MDTCPTPIKVEINAYESKSKLSKFKSNITLKKLSIPKSPLVTSEEDKKKNASNIFGINLNFGLFVARTTKIFIKKGKTVALLEIATGKIKYVIKTKLLKTESDNFLSFLIINLK